VKTAIDQSHQGAFPTAIGAEDGGVLARAQLQGEIMEHALGVDPSLNGREVEPSCRAIGH
jgi:hypothetical protein